MINNESPSLSHEWNDYLSQARSLIKEYLGHFSTEVFYPNYVGLRLHEVLM